MLSVFVITIENQTFQTRLSERIRELGGCKKHEALVCYRQGFLPPKELQGNILACFDSVKEMQWNNRWEGVHDENQAMYEIVHYVARNYPTLPWILMEEAVPMEQSWMDKLQAEFERTRPLRLGVKGKLTKLHPIHGDRIPCGEYLKKCAVYRPTLVKECPLLRNVGKYNMAMANATPKVWWLYAAPELARGAVNSELMGDQGPVMKVGCKEFPEQAGPPEPKEEVPVQPISGVQSERIAPPLDTDPTPHLKGWFETRRKARRYGFPGKVNQAKKPELEAFVEEYEARHGKGSQ